MNRKELNERFCAVVKDYDRVGKLLEKPPTRQVRKCSYKEVLDDFMMSGDLQQTGLAFGLSKAGVYNIIRKAIYIAERLRNSDARVAGRRG